MTISMITRTTPASSYEIAKRVTGTHLTGYIKATRAQLTKVFGKPRVTDGHDKVNVQWALMLGGNVVTIYDYKEEKAPKANEVYNWHIGGNSDLDWSPIVRAMLDGEIKAEIVS